MWYTRKNDVITLDVYVQPGAKSTEIIGLYDKSLKIRLAVQAIEGRANNALQKYIAELFHVPSRQVKILRGAKSRYKTLEIANSCVDPEQLLLGREKE